jgi:hypothetical protein
VKAANQTGRGLLAAGLEMNVGNLGTVSASCLETELRLKEKRTSVLEYSFLNIKFFQELGKDMSQ